MEVEFEYTAICTSQQNDHVEWKFATLFNQVCAMLIGGIFTFLLRNGLWAQAANTITLLENYLITPNRTLSSFQQFLGKKKKHPVFGSKIW